MEPKPSAWWPATPLGQIALCAFLILCFCAVAIRPIPGHSMFTPSAIGTLLISRLDAIPGVVNSVIFYFLFVGVRWFTVVRRRSVPTPEASAAKVEHVWISPGNKWLLWALLILVAISCSWFFFPYGIIVAAPIGFLLHHRRQRGM